MRNKKNILVSFILMLVPLAIGAFFYSKMPEQLPTHFGLDGNPDKFSSKDVALFQMPIIMVGVQLIMVFMLNKDPRKKYQSEKLYIISLFIIPILTIMISSLTVAYGMGSKVEINRIIIVAISLLFVVMGNFLPKSKRNYTMGIKNPWTLSSDVIWEKTHRLGGYTFVISGIVGIVFGLVLKNSAFAIFMLIMAAGIIPTVYSYILYERENKQ